MIPRVFVSSTIRDLQHIRDAVRDIIGDLGYQPVMSEHGEIGYLPSMAAADACYHEARDCDLGILIVGKRYGDIHTDGVSVTQQEYRTLLSQRVPVVSLVERDLFASKSIYDASENREAVTFPGMDRPASTFAFLNEIMASPFNNGVSEFRHVSEVRNYVKAQLAHIFGDLLRRRSEADSSEMRDILSAIASLRHEMLSGRSEPSSNRFLRASRALLEDSSKNYKQFLTSFFRSFDPAVQAVIEHETFDDLMGAHKVSIVLRPDTESFQEWVQANATTWASMWGISSPGSAQNGVFQYGGYAALQGGGVAMTESVLTLFRANHLAIRAQAID